MTGKPSRLFLKFFIAPSRFDRRVTAGATGGLERKQRPEGRMRECRDADPGCRWPVFFFGLGTRSFSLDGTARLYGREQTEANPGPGFCTYTTCDQASGQLELQSGSPAVMGMRHWFRSTGPRPDNRMAGAFAFATGFARFLFYRK